MDVMKILIYILIGLEGFVAVLIGIAVIKETVKERKNKKAKETESASTSVQESLAAEETPTIVEKSISEMPATQPNVYTDAKVSAHEDKTISPPRERKRRRLCIVKSDAPAKSANRISVDNAGGCDIDEKLVRIKRR